MKKKILSIACVLVGVITFAQLPTDGLVAHYPFNGNANDESTNSNDGTVNGATLTTDRFGNVNSAYSFDGVDDYISFGKIASFNTGVNDFTVNLWVKRISTTSGGDNNSLSQWNTSSSLGTNEWSMHFPNEKLALVVESNTSHHLVSSSTSIDTSGWFFCTVSRESDSIKVYVDGKHEGSKFIGNIPINSFNSDFLLGKIFYNGNVTTKHFNNAIFDDIRLYNKSLDLTEIKSIFNEGVCYKTVQDTSYVTVYDTVRTHINSLVPTSGLVGYYPFNGNTNDESTNSNDGTVNGATLTTDRFGNVNSAYSFDGISNIEVPNNSILNGNLQKLSISLWVKAQSQTHGQNLVGADMNDRGYIVNIGGSTQKVEFAIASSSASSWDGVVTQETVATNDEWHHIVAVYDGSTMKTYFNGVQNGTFTGATPSSIRAVSSELYFGGYRADNFLSGSLDDIRIYNNALTECQVQSLLDEDDNKLKVTVQDTLNIYLSQIITSINDASQAVTTVKVYPNPTENEVTISIDNYTNLSGVTLKVINSQSAEVHNEAVTGPTQSIDVSSWSAGIYFLQVLNGTDIVDIRKIVVNN